MHTDELYDRFASVFILKETPSREKHKTSFGVLTTIELNLQVELTKSCKRQAAYIKFNRFFYKSRATSYEPQAASFKLEATSYELQVMSYEIRDMSYKLRDTRYKIAPAPADVGLISKLNVRGHHLQTKVIMSSQLHCKMLLRR
jgi:hypothetical protein